MNSLASHPTMPVDPGTIQDDPQRPSVVLRRPSGWGGAPVALPGCAHLHSCAAAGASRDRAAAAQELGSLADGGQAEPGWNLRRHPMAVIGHDEDVAIADLGEGHHDPLCPAVLEAVGQ